MKKVFIGVRLSNGFHEILIVENGMTDPDTIRDAAMEQVPGCKTVLISIPNCGGAR